MPPLCNRLILVQHSSIHHGAYLSSHKAKGGTYSEQVAQWHSQYDQLWIACWLNPCILGLTHVYLSVLWEDATRTERASKPHNNKGPLWLWIKTCDCVTAVNKTKHITALFCFFWVFCLIRHFKFVLKVVSFPLCPRLNWTIVLFLVLHLHINLLLQWSMAY